MNQLIAVIFESLLYLCLLAALPWFVVALIKLWREMPTEWDDKDEDEDEAAESDKPPRRQPEPPRKEWQAPAESKQEKVIRVKGQIGEQHIKIKILEQLDRRFYRVFHNLIIPSGGGTTQIDHIIVSPYGIFVVEAKYFAGWIYGGAQQKKWTHTLSHRQKYPFQNPLHQNYKHVKALSELLRLPEKYFISVVVFTHRNCQLKTVLPDNVCLLDGFIPYIQKFQQLMLDGVQLQAACAELSRPQYAATEERVQAHIQSLNGRNP